MIIKETYSLGSSTEDVFAAPSRLNAIPSRGVLTLELSCTDGQTTNHGLVTLQLPGGELPFENMRMPYNAYSADYDVMHDDTSLVFQFQVEQGGHVLLSYEEVGTVVGLFVIATLEF